MDAAFDFNHREKPPSFVDEVNVLIDQEPSPDFSTLAREDRAAHEIWTSISALYGRNYDAMRGRAFVTALTGSTLATLASSLVKAVPGIGTVIGGLSGMVIAGASTYAVGEVAADVFESGKDIGEIVNQLLKKNVEFVEDLT